MGMLDVKPAVDVDRAGEVLFGFESGCALDRGVDLLGGCDGSSREYEEECDIATASKKPNFICPLSFSHLQSSFQNTVG